MLYETDAACEEKTEGFPLGVPEGPLDAQTAVRWLRGHDLIPSETGWMTASVMAFDNAETAKRAEQLFRQTTDRLLHDNGELERQVNNYRDRLRLAERRAEKAELALRFIRSQYNFGDDAELIGQMFDQIIPTFAENTTELRLYDLDVTDEP